MLSCRWNAGHECDNRGPRYLHPFVKKPTNGWGTRLKATRKLRMLRAYLMDGDVELQVERWS